MKATIWTLLAGCVLVGVAEVAIYGCREPIKAQSPSVDLALLRDSLRRAHSADSAQTAQWIDSLRTMPPETLRVTLRRYVERYTTDTLIRRDTVPVVVESGDLRRLLADGQMCRDSLRWSRDSISVLGVVRRIDSTDKAVDLQTEVERRKRWTAWAAGIGMCAGLVLASGMR